MGAFQTGLKFGMDAWDSAEDQKLRQREMAMREQEAAQRQAEFSWRQNDRQSQDAAFKNYSALQGGVVDGSKVDFGTSVSAPGGLGPVPASQQAQPTGLQLPDGTRAPLVQRTASPAELLAARQNIAVAMRDPNALTTLEAEAKAQRKDAVAASVMKTSLKDLERQAADINLSGYPMLYTGKDKNGYTFLKTEADGKTPIAGSQFTLNEAQLRQVALAHAYGEAGFGADAMATLQAAHKDIAGHIGEWNKVQEALAKGNNTATHDAAQDQNGLITARAHQTQAGAAMMNANTTRDLKNAQLQDIRDAQGRREEAVQLQAQWDKLTPAQQQGDEGRGLLTRFNMLNVRNGGQINLGRPATGGSGAKKLLDLPVEQKKNDDGTYTAFSKDGGRALYNTYNGFAIPLGMTSTTLESYRKQAQDVGVELVNVETDSGVKLGFVGGDGQTYSTAAEAAKAKAPAKTGDLPSGASTAPPAPALTDARSLYERSGQEARQVALPAKRAAEAAAATASRDPALYALWAEYRAAQRNNPRAVPEIARRITQYQQANAR